MLLSLARVFALSLSILGLFGPGLAKADVAEWERLAEPVITGQYIASDPAILKDGDIFRMFYTCWIVPETGFVPDDVRAAICQATSIDGITWTDVPVEGNTPGLMVRGIEDSWQEHLEAAFIVKIEGTYLLYFSGYVTEGDPLMGFPAELTVAVSTDGFNFERVTDDPVLAPTTGWYDNDAVYSPTIVLDGDELVMIYAGHCYTVCDEAYGNALLSARSSDGFIWVKDEQPVLTGGIDGIDWLADGVAEPGLVQGPDGAWYLFITGLQGEGRTIGIAIGDTPVGPFTVEPEPILTADGSGFDGGQVLAPMVLIEGDLARMWYLGFPAGAEGYAIGYAEAEWPLIKPTT